MRRAQTRELVARNVKLAKRVGPGDVLEISTKRGLSYAVVTHRVEGYGDLLRVFAPAYSERPTNWSFVLATEPAFSCFCPATAAVRHGFASVVARVELTSKLNAFPLFKCARGVDPVTLVATSWWLWDGVRDWRTGDVLTESERRLPERATYTPELLRRHVETCYTEDQHPNIDGVGNSNGR